MTIRFATPEEITRWNTLVLHNPDSGNIFQGYEFAIHKKLGGWKPVFLLQDDLAFTVLEKKFLGKKLWYASKGPGVGSVERLRDLLPSLREFALKNGVFLVKTEFEVIKTDETTTALTALGLKQARSIQPSSTVLLDLSPDLKTILMNLNQKGRHAIKRAERDGVSVKKVPASDENCKIMFDLLTATAAGSFSIRSYKYYKDYWQTYENQAMGQLFFAYVNGQVVAGAYALIFGQKSTYKDGASVRERPVYGASHLLQWHVIEWAKLKGSKVHDLCGTPSSANIKNPNDPFYGLGRFKTSFNKEVTDYVGVYDVMIRPFVYKVWTKIGERIVRKIHWLRHHENYY